MTPDLLLNALSVTPSAVVVLLLRLPPSSFHTTPTPVNNVMQLLTSMQALVTVIAQNVTMVHPSQEMWSLPTVSSATLLQGQDLVI